MARSKKNDQPRRLMGPVAVCMTCMFLWVSLLTFSIADWPSADVFPHNDPAHNACGRLGAWVSYQVFHWIGDGAYPLVLFLSFAGGMWLVNGRIANLGQRAFGVVLLVCCTSTTVGLIASGGANSLAIGDGGVLGVALGQILLSSFSKIGTVLVLLYSMLVGVLFAAEGWMLRIPGAMEKIRDVSAVAASAAKSRLSDLTPAIAGVGAQLRGTVDADEDVPFNAAFFTEFDGEARSSN